MANTSRDNLWDAGLDLSDAPSLSESDIQIDLSALEHGDPAQMVSAVLDAGQASDEEEARTIKVRVVQGKGKLIRLRLEGYVWEAIDELCTRENISLTELVGSVAVLKGNSGALSSAVRAYTLGYFREASRKEDEPGNP